MPDCTPAAHDSAKTSPDTFRTQLANIREGLGLLWGECPACHSTLALRCYDVGDRVEDPAKARPSARSARF